MSRFIQLHQVKLKAKEARDSRLTDFGKGVDVGQCYAACAQLMRLCSTDRPQRPQLLSSLLFFP